MRDLMSEEGWVFPVMVDTAGVTNDYGIRFIPTQVVIDREGQIAEQIVGAVTAAGLSSLIDGLNN